MPAARIRGSAPLEMRNCVADEPVDEGEMSAYLLAQTAISVSRVRSRPYRASFKSGDDFAKIHRKGRRRSGTLGDTLKRHTDICTLVYIWQIS